MNSVKTIILIIVLPLIISVQNLRAQSDTIFSEQADTMSQVQAEPIRIVIPVKATMMAAAFPGLGQVYNKKYWKIPFVYLGFGALGYSIINNSQNFNDYLNAYSHLTDGIPETVGYQELGLSFDPGEIDPALEAENYDAQTHSWIKDQLLNAVSYYRKYRDLSYIGVGFWYLISILDAHVDAVLFDYDISPDLSITIEPVPITMAYGRTVGVGVKVRF